MTKCARARLPRIWPRAGRADLGAAELRQGTRWLDCGQVRNLTAQRRQRARCVDQAQAAYDRIKGAPDVGARPESLQLQQATNNFNAADAAYQDAQGHPTETELAAASA